MSAVEPLYRILNIDTSILSKEEKVLLEAELFLRICRALKEEIKKIHKHYFNLIKLPYKMEETVLENLYIPSAIQDLMTNHEYTAEGIARYINTPVDVIYALMEGTHHFPSAFVLRRIIELHRSVRRDIYENILKKIAVQYITTIPPSQI